MSRLGRGPPFSGAAVAFIGRRIATLLLFVLKISPPFMGAHVIPPTRAISPPDLRNGSERARSQSLTGLWREGKTALILVRAQSGPLDACRHPANLLRKPISGQG